MSKQLLIVGASVRAAAQSAKRAGFEVVAADLFGDRDLGQIARCHRVEEYPSDFAKLRNKFAELPLVYTGAIENYPELVAEFELNGPLWGTPSETLRFCRDPFRFCEVLGSAGIRFPETTKTLPSQSNREWLEKRVQSCAGLQVRSLSGHGQQVAAPDDGWFYQERIDGEACSAAYVAGQGTVQLLGTSKMLVGRDWGSKNAFGYCGSIAYQPDAALKEQWQAIGLCLANEFELRGVFGVDAIQNQREIVPIEINPRYTASMECHEPSLEQSIMAMHAASFADQPLPIPSIEFRPCSKLIVYADREIRTTDLSGAALAAGASVSRHATAIGLMGRIADIPQPNLTISAGEPVLSFITEVADPDRLRASATEILNSLSG